ncbi:MAG: class I SAM-dependent methyltransferase [Sulfobacillus sp.]
MEVPDNQSVPGLEQLIDHSRTDKGSLHSYLSSYEELMGGKRASVEAVLEIGIYLGGSLELWRDYFPRAEVTGVDIVDGMWYFRSSERIVVRAGTNAYDPDLVRSMVVENRRFDLIVDDGPHSLESMLFLLRNYLYLLSPGGTLVIEDIQSIDWIEQLKQAVPDFLRSNIRVIDLRSIKDRYDDVLFVVQMPQKKVPEP